MDVVTDGVVAGEEMMPCTETGPFEETLVLVLVLELILPAELWALTAVPATADDTEGDKLSLLLAELQHVPVPVASQQNPPFGMTEFSHSTTNLSVPISSQLNTDGSADEASLPLQNDGQIGAL